MANINIAVAVPVTAFTPPIPAIQCPRCRPRMRRIDSLAKPRRRLSYSSSERYGTPSASLFTETLELGHPSHSAHQIPKNWGEHEARRQIPGRARGLEAPVPKHRTALGFQNH